jgi:CubicO group peptidase (beta-lactamase class C family)
VDDYLQAVMEKNHVPGVATAIVRDGKVEKIATYGLADLESEAKVGPDTSFQIASATKIFTGTLVMLLVQEGKLGLDEPLSRAASAWRSPWAGCVDCQPSGTPVAARSPACCASRMRS